MAEQNRRSLRVEVTPDGGVASIVIPSQYTGASITVGHCMRLLEAEGIQITPQVTAALEALSLGSPEPSQEERRVEVAWGKPVLHGDNGRVEWLASLQPENSHQENISYYDRQSYVTAHAGEIIGRVIPPTEGAPGCDVRGRMLPNRTGKPIDLRCDDTIDHRENGELVAKIDGVLWRSGQQASIHKLLEIEGSVDFSSGNIDFDGDVTIRGGICDCFVVKATGNVRVSGLIEEGHVRCDGDLAALGGFAGRERGQVEVKGNLLGKYLDHIHGWIDGDLRIDREVISCRLTVGGAVQMPQGSIISSHVMIGGRVEIGTLGSPAVVNTELTLGVIPRLEGPQRELLELLEKLAARQAELETEIDQLAGNSSHIGGSSRQQRGVELKDELRQVVQELDRGTKAEEALRLRMARLRTVNVTIGRVLYPGVVFHIWGTSYRVNRELRGPVRLVLGDDSQPVYIVNDQQAPLELLAPPISTAKTVGSK